MNPNSTISNENKAREDLEKFVSEAWRRDHQAQDKNPIAEKESDAEADEYE